jgi:hypothetical protein
MEGGGDSSRRAHTTERHQPCPGMTLRPTWTTCWWLGLGATGASAAQLPSWEPWTNATRQLAREKFIQRESSFFLCLNSDLLEHIIRRRTCSSRQLEEEGMYRRKVPSYPCLPCKSFHPSSPSHVGRRYLYINGPTCPLRQAATSLQTPGQFRPCPPAY